jgi:hypothetical protein
VELAVELDPVDRICRRLHPAGQCLGRVEFLGGDVLDALLHRERDQQGTDLVDVVELGPGDLVHGRAVESAVFDQPLRHQVAERFPHRGDAHPQGLRELRLHQPGPTGQLAGDDRLT